VLGDGTTAVGNLDGDEQGDACDDDDDGDGVDDGADCKPLDPAVAPGVAEKCEMTA